MLRFFIWCFVLLYVFFRYTKQYRDPCTAEMYVGKIGSGKTTSIVQYVYKVNSHRTPWERVYVNVPDIHGAYYFDFADVLKQLKQGICPFEPMSAVLIDEGGIEMFSRNFRNFDMELVRFFKLCRHYRLYVRVYSQAFDIDKSVRNIVTGLYVSTKFLGVLTVHRPVIKKLGISTDEEGNGQLVDTYKYDWIFGYKFTFIPRWVKHFDSYNTEKVIMNDFIYNPYADGELESFRYRSKIADGLRHKKAIFLETLCEIKSALAVKIKKTKSSLMKSFSRFLQRKG